MSLNCKYIGGTKTFMHFKKALIEILDVYKNKNEYKDKILNINGALAYYNNNNDIIIY